MKIYDISVPVHHDMHLYPGDPRFQSSVWKSISNGDPYESHKIRMGNHCGTHVDAPSHFVKDGASLMDLSLEMMNGKVRVIEIHAADKIDVPELQQVLRVDAFRVLFKTRNSLLWTNLKHFSKKYVFLTADGARYLSENGIKLIGFDYLSIDAYGEETYPAHKILLENQVIVIEGLNLAEVEEGDYEMSCLPLPLAGLDAAPARVILKK